MASQPRHQEFTIKAPQFAYAHLELHTDGTETEPVALDELLVRSYCADALQGYHGLTGAAVPLDVLKVAGAECWLRVPREDVRALAAALTACRGSVQGGVLCLLRIRQCSDWLGTISGASQEKLWQD